MVRLLPLLLALSLLAGCASVSTRERPRADLQNIQRFFVEKRLGDDHRIDELIVAELQRHGRTATSGPLTMAPDDAEAIVSYNDRWAWDFSTYLIEASLEIRRARTDKPIAAASYHRAVLSRQTPADAIRVMLDPLFAAPKRPARQ
ncbi:hypothetical protein K0B96_11920 [Horticoccus luteus]|uniref:DUF4296 domain-containing protein n=1 Tax=Horticoccus luteus TaxID=2862869 RepID=A0A8F9TS53_9BACT|nr:hypothetical protein [Horticoccus luteus]QYM78016.1 hypothetical protein K0B96_11920 [Horticoccus luteus]